MFPFLIGVLSVTSTNKGVGLHPDQSPIVSWPLPGSATSRQWTVYMDPPLSWKQKVICPV